MDPLAQAISGARRPRVDRLEARLIALEERVAANVPRKSISAATKQRHREAVTALGGRCPCCGVTEIINTHGAVIDAEYDHFYSRERRNFDETWLICRPCNRDMKNRHLRTSEFQAYQRRAAQLESGQTLLFDAGRTS